MEKQFIAEYIIKCLMLLNRVHIVIEKFTAGCQQTFCWWQPVVTRHFASDNRLSADKKVWWQPVVSRPRLFYILSASVKINLEKKKTLGRGPVFWFALNQTHWLFSFRILLEKYDSKIWASQKDWFRNKILLHCL